MKNVVKDIKQNCDDKTIEGIVSFLVSKHDLNYLSNHHREIWFFYKELRDSGETHKDSRALTMSHFRLNSSYFKKVVKKYKNNPFGAYIPQTTKKTDL